MRRLIWAWARVLAGTGILGLLLWHLGTGAFLDGLRAVDGRTLALAFGIGVLTTVLSAWRWCLVARGLGIRLPLPGAVADYYRALFLNAALPGGVVGDVHRAVRHGRDVGDVGRGVRAVILERAAGQAVLLAVGAVVLLAYPTPVLPHPRVLALLAVAACGVAGLGAWLATQVRRPGASRWGRALGRTLGDVRRGLLTRRTLPGILLASALVLAGHLTTFLVAARTAGSAAPLGRLVPLTVLALLAMALPVNIGGWGPREGVSAWAFGAAGLSAAQGLTVAVVYGLFVFVASLPGAAVLLLRWIDRRRAGRAGPATVPEATVRTQVTVPLRFADGYTTTARVFTFHGLVDGREHLALGLGDWQRSLERGAGGGPAPLVRPHSECLTGDVFGSQRCDCGPQLREAVERIARAGGFLLYLRQEGRGIGLYPKLDAYALQEAGLDTYEANRALGRAEDERDYTAAAQMLRALGAYRVALFSNNPDKARQLCALGVVVTERIPTGVHLSPANLGYLAAKANHAAHTLDLPAAG